MEVWILLAAAGSGYLARCWQNAHKNQCTPVDEADDDRSAETSKRLGPSRHFYSAHGRPYPGKSGFGKGYHCWGRHLPKHGQTTSSTGNPMEQVEEGSISLDGNVRSASKDAGDRSDNLQLHNSGNELLALKDCSPKCNQMWDVPTENTCEYQGITLAEFQELSMSYEAERGLLGEILEENNDTVDYNAYTKRLSSGGCIGSSTYGSDLQGGDQVGASIDVKASKVLEEPNMSGGTWMPGFCDVFQGVFILDADSGLSQPVDASNTKISVSEETRTSNKYGRGRGFTSRRKVLALRQKPMSSLESCLSAQLDEVCHLRASGGLLPLIHMPGRESSENASVDHRSSIIASSSMLESDAAAGLSSLLMQSSVVRTTNTSLEVEHEASKGGSLCNVYTGNQSRICSKLFHGSSGLADLTRRGLSSTPCQGLLFNFGVGVGMMFSIMSNLREVWKLAMLLKEAESLIRDLGGELEGKGSCSATSAERDVLVDQRKLAINSTLRRIRSATKALNSMKVCFNHELEPNARTELQSKDMAMLEAELEAELERMDLNLNGKRTSDNWGYLSCSKGESQIQGLPGDGSESWHGDLVTKSYGVSPRELENRLHEVLEARQEERISKLEAELKRLGNKLLAKEQEIHLWKDELVSADANSESVSHDDNHALTEVCETELHPSTQAEEEWASWRAYHSPNASPASPCFDEYFHLASCKSDSSLSQKAQKLNESTTFITLGGDALAAYNEACKEFSIVNHLPSEGCPFSRKQTDEQHMFSEGEIQKERTGQKSYGNLVQVVPFQHLEQVDLLSLANDLYVGDHSGLGPSTASSNEGKKSSMLQMGMTLGHPEPEYTLPCSKSSSSADDSTDKTSGSTPCSVKHVDVTTTYSLCQVPGDGEIEVDSRRDSSFFNWEAGLSIHPRANSLSHEGLLFSSQVSDLKASDGPTMQSTNNTGWGSPEASDSILDLDEELGQLLIKRIVKKIRRGSPIIQHAQAMLDSFEISETAMDFV